jgi:hypothetical protein
LKSKTINLDPSPAYNITDIKKELDVDLAMPPEIFLSSNCLINRRVSDFTFQAAG